MIVGFAAESRLAASISPLNPSCSSSACTLSNVHMKPSQHAAQTVVVGLGSFRMFELTDDMMDVGEYLRKLIAE